MNRLFRLVAALLAGAAIAVAFGVAPSGATRAGNSVTYHDSTGEDPASLDIQQIVVSNDDSGLVSFAINLGNAGSFGANSGVLILIDTNNNANDGAGPMAGGADLVLDVANGSVDLGRWNGSTFDYSGGSPSSLTYSYTGGVVTVKVNAHD